MCWHHKYLRQTEKEMGVTVQEVWKNKTELPEKLCRLFTWLKTDKSLLAIVRAYNKADLYEMENLCICVKEILLMYMTKWILNLMKHICTEAATQHASTIYSCCRECFTPQQEKEKLPTESWEKNKIWK